MVYKCTFNEKLDQNKVLPGRSINLRSAAATGVVKSTGVNMEFNELDDPYRIGNRVEDVFDAINSQRDLQRQVHQKAAAAKAAKAANAAAEQVLSTQTGEVD